MQKESKALMDAGIAVVGISYDSVETLKAFSDKQKIGFPLLSDKGSKVINAFGIRNKTMDGEGDWAGVPYPGTFVVDKKGVVRVKLFEKGYKKRHGVEELVAAVKALEEVK